MDEGSISGNTSTSSSQTITDDPCNSGSNNSAGVKQGSNSGNTNTNTSSNTGSSSATPSRQVFPSGDLGVAQMLDSWNEFPNPPLAGLRSSSTCGCTSSNGTSSSDGGSSGNGCSDSNGSSNGSGSSRFSSSGDSCSSPSCPGRHWASVLDAAVGRPVLSFSHFLPRLELLPEKRFLMFPNLAKAVGSSPLNSRVQQLTAVASSHVHVFGHTHFAWDTTLDGVRYLQAPLCYPTERSRRLKSIVLQQDVTRHVSNTHNPGSDALHDRGQPRSDAHQVDPPLQEEVTLLQSEQVDEAPPSQQQQQQRQQQQLHPQQQAAAAALPLQQQQQRPESTSSLLPWLPVLVYEGHCTDPNIINSHQPQTVVQTITSTTLAPRSKATPSLHSTKPDQSQEGDHLTHNAAHPTPTPNSPSQPAALPACQGTGNNKASQVGFFSGQPPAASLPDAAAASGTPSAAADMPSTCQVSEAWHSMHHVAAPAVMAAAVVQQTACDRFDSFNDTAGQPPSFPVSAPTVGGTLAVSLPPSVGSKVQGPLEECWEGWFLPALQAMWSSHYETHPRTPEVLELAPWVAPLYARTQRMMKQRQQQGAPTAGV
ncbi:MAG: hypothetical protein WDW38_004911 [Sanguina aurantia]